VLAAAEDRQIHVMMELQRVLRVDLAAVLAALAEAVLEVLEVYPPIMATVVA
jgi:hypothetical protein